MRHSTIRTLVLGAWSGALCSCYAGAGQGDDSGSGASAASQSSGDEATGGDPTEGDPVDPPAQPNEVAYAGLRRLTAEEYNLTVRDLLGVDASGELLLPQDLRSPFDNNYRLQSASQALIDGADLLAADLAEAALSDPAARDALVGCTPTAPDDAACFEEFVATFGRRALRRSLDTEELGRFAAFLAHGAEAGDFYVAIDSALRAFLQHPEFLYRVEIGEPVAGEAGVYRLGPNEVATRLSYFLWGTTPPDWLLDAAESDGLDTPEEIRAAATELLADPRAHARIARFHAMWLGYEEIPLAPALSAAMQAETQALIDRALFTEGGVWQDLLRSEQTYVDDTLAAHYGVPLPGSDTPTWVDYGDTGRRGLLSHGSFLSIGAKFDDTSPTQRGLLIRTRLFCMDIKAPPNVDVDNPPEAMDPSACKPERYAVHTQAGCAGCHDLMDPIGFGLENYDSAGRFRTHEPDRPDCEIAGEGEMVGVGSFSGPGELSALVLQAPELNRCVITQLYRFASGRFELHEHDHAFIAALAESAPPGTDLKFVPLLLDFVASSNFQHRREEPADI